MRKENEGGEGVGEKGNKRDHITTIPVSTETSGDSSRIYFMSFLLYLSRVLGGRFRSLYVSIHISSGCGSCSHRLHVHGRNSIKRYTDMIYKSRSGLLLLRVSDQ